MVPSKVALAPKRVREKTGKISRGIKGNLLWEEVVTKLRAVFCSQCHQRLQMFDGMINCLFSFGVLPCLCNLPTKVTVILGGFSGSSINPAPIVFGELLGYTPRILTAKDKDDIRLL